MSCDDRRLVSTSGWGDIGSRLRTQWIGNAIRAAEEVIDDDCAWSARLLWWVHLYAILGELKEFLVGLSTPLFAGDPAPREPFKQAVKCIDALQQVFTEDELLYIQYRRDEACHPVADSYQPRVRDGKVKKAKETLLGVRPLLDIREATKRVLKTTNNDEIHSAKDLATRSYRRFETYCPPPGRYSLERSVRRSAPGKSKPNTVPLSASKPLALPVVMSSRLLRSLSFWDVVPFFVGAPFLAAPLRRTRGISSPSSSALSDSLSEVSFIPTVFRGLP